MVLPQKLIGLPLDKMNYAYNLLLPSDNLNQNKAAKGHDCGKQYGFPNNSRCSRILFIKPALVLKPINVDIKLTFLNQMQAF